MPEIIPVPGDNLYDDAGRVKDRDAAEEMADLEKRHREIDKARLYEHRSPEWHLEQRLETLVGRKLTRFEVDNDGTVKLTFDNCTLSFTSWDAARDQPDFDGVNIQSRETE